MQVIEPCILKYEILNIVKSIGYTQAFLEVQKNIVNRDYENDIYFRKTLIPHSQKEFKRNIEQLRSKVLIFVKPTSFEIFRLSLKSADVNAITFDRYNYHILLRKSSYNLLKQNPKPIEVSLKNWTYILLRRVAEIGYKLSIPILFSSCASEFNELWSPMSKVAFLETAYIYPEYALLWVFKSPYLILKR